MIVELYGLPASGKSTFARACVERFGFETSRTRPLALPVVLQGCIRRHALCVALARHALRGQPLRGLWYRLKNFVLTRMGELERADQRSGPVPQVLDEGPLQALLSTATNVTVADVCAVLAHTPATMIVVFEPPQELRHAHAAQRTYKLRPYLSEAERVTWEGQVGRNHAIVLEALAHDERVRIIHDEHEAEVLLQSFTATLAGS